MTHVSVHLNADKMCDVGTQTDNFFRMRAFKGYVQSYMADKGYGFINSRHFRTYFHINDVLDNSKIDVGQEVTFYLQEGLHEFSPKAMFVTTFPMFEENKEFKYAFNSSSNIFELKKNHIVYRAPTEQLLGKRSYSSSFSSSSSSYVKKKRRRHKKHSRHKKSRH